MNNICIIVVYFGKFPNYFHLFFQSVRNNTDIDFLFVTNQDIENCSNIRTLKMSFEQFKGLVCSKLGKHVCLSKPYKICDYRPAFGILFEEFLKGYKFWGHCDTDMIFGRISHFLPNDLENYSKIYQWGHLSLYKNCAEINEVFKNKCKGMSYEEVFSTEKNKVFDEYGIQEKFDALQLLTYKKKDNADITLNSLKFKRTMFGDNEGIIINYKQQIFCFIDGKVMRYYVEDGAVQHDEMNYIHFKKRVFKDVPKDNVSKFIICHKGMFPIQEEITKNYIIKNQKTSFFDELGWRLKAKVNKYKFRLQNHLKR